MHYISVLRKEGSYTFLKLPQTSCLFIYKHEIIGIVLPCGYLNIYEYRFRTAKDYLQH